ncbi:MAG: hypothetical protein GXP51_12270 [Deltaproteobacteria bacterium]|nr:hypothetical protein [Deltaproteobacteria bacterium]
MLNDQTLAAVLLICASIIHNYSFMCRKLPTAELKVAYPTSTLGVLLLDLSWMLMAAAGIYLTFTLSAVLSAVAAAIYFLVLPFLLQPPLARLLGFRSLSEYLNHVEQSQQRPGNH